MWYFLTASAFFSAGFVFSGLFAAGKRADLITLAYAANQRAYTAERANGVLRRELAELRATEAPRDHGYGQAHG